MLLTLIQSKRITNAYLVKRCIVLFATTTTGYNNDINNNNNNNNKFSFEFQYNKDSMMVMMHFNIFGWKNHFYISF